MKSTVILTSVVILLLLVGCGLVDVDQANSPLNGHIGNNTTLKAPITIYWDLVLQFIVAQLGIVGAGSIRNKIIKKGVINNDKH